MRLHNAVIASEAKKRMRSWRAPVGIFVYVSMLFLLGGAYFLATFGKKGGVSLMQVANNGISGYVILAIMQFVLMIFAVPAVTAGTISAEREKQTLDLLLCTRMRPISIIVGKLFSSMGFVLLLVVASAPVYALSLLFGGILVMDLVKLFIFYIMTALYSGSIGMLCSCLFKRTTVATISSYAIIMAIGIGTIFLGFTQYQAQEAKILAQAQQQTVPLSGVYAPSVQSTQIKMPTALYFNPGVGLVDLLIEQASGVTNDYFYGGSIFYGALPFSRSIFSPDSVVPMPVWVLNSISGLAVSIVCVLWSSWLIRPLKRRDKRIAPSKAKKARAAKS